MELIGSRTFVDRDGHLVRQDDYFDEATGMPYFDTVVLKYGYRKVQPEVELERYQTTSWTGATIEVRKWRDRFGQIHTDEKVIRLNNGDDDDCAPDGRWD